jgi:hypothetical protein
MVAAWQEHAPSHGGGAPTKGRSVREGQPRPTTTQREAMVDPMVATTGRLWRAQNLEISYDLRIKIHGILSHKTLQAIFPRYDSRYVLV